MGLFSWITDRFSGRSVTKSAGEKRLIEFIGQGWNPHRPRQWSSDRYELPTHYTGWNYVAIRAIAEEIAGQTPSVARIVDQKQLARKVEKSLRDAKSRSERASIEQWYKSAVLPKHMKRKALAHLQDSDELMPVGSSHPLVRLLKNPNPPDVAWTFQFKLAMHAEIHGVDYVWKVPNAMGKPCQLWAIPPHWVREIPGEDELIEAYEIRPTDVSLPSHFAGHWGIGGAAVGRKPIPAKQMIRTAYPSPFNFVDGYSPLQAMGAWTDVADGIDRSKAQHFVNGAFPGVALEMDKDFGEPSAEEVDRIKAKIAAEWSGVKNHRKVVVLVPGLRMVPVTQTSVEMDYVNSGNQMRDWQLAGHRVGPTMAGLAEQTTYAASQAARANFYHSTIRPKLMLRGQTWTEQLAADFDENLCIYWPDPTPDDPEFRLRRAQVYLPLGVTHVNEVRDEEGWEPYQHGGDDPVQSMGAQTVPWNTGEQPEPPPGMGMPGMPGMMPGMEQQPQPGMEQQPGQPPTEQQGQEEEPFDLPAYQFSQDDGEPQGQQGPPPEQETSSEETSSGLTLDELMGKKKKPLPSPISKRLNGKVVANGKH